MEIKFKLDLRPVFIEDKKSGGVTAYFKDFEGAIAEGETHEEAINSLALTFKTMVLNEPEVIKQIIESNPQSFTIDMNHLN